MLRPLEPRMTSRLARSLALIASTAGMAALALVADPRAAQACGGTFCDNLPQPMPVDQRGEDILFVLDGSTVEVHVRIEYTGEAERFAWILPIQGVPEIAVGSDLLFTAMSGALAPSWSTITAHDCEPGDPTGDPTGDDGVKLDLADTPPPTVVLEAIVGAYEVVVLQGGSAVEVIEFLTANGYAQDPAATPILQEYLDEGFLFAAVKLAAGADASAIHPLAFKFAGDEPCVPIRLTRIAAEDDMAVRAYFLGQERWAPRNYQHVVLNPLAYPWHQPSAEAYLELLSLAVDEAGGHAFATEYAGPSSIVPDGDIYRPSWDESAFLGIDPIAALDQVASQGLSAHPLIASLLLEFIPPPEGVAPALFWNNIAEFADQIDLEAWDDVAFAAAIAERIIEPGLHAVDLLASWPTLTRLHTTLSPHEMTVDPMFVANADLPDVAGSQVTTTQQVLCAGDRVFHVALEGVDNPLCVPAGAEYPVWSAMPYALRVEQIPSLGPAQVITDNAELIASEYASEQATVECMADGGGDGDGDDGPSAGDDAGTETGEPVYNLPYDIACGCTAERDAAPVGVALGLIVLGLISPWRRRRAP